MKVEFRPANNSDGALVRLYDFDAKEAMTLKGVFESLAAGRVDEVVLTEKSGVVGVNNFHFVLSSGDTAHGVVQDSKSSKLKCILTPAGWASVAGLTTPFCEHLDTGHYQWLDDTGAISLLIAKTNPN